MTKINDSSQQQQRFADVTSVSEVSDL